MAHCPRRRGVGAAQWGSEVFHGRCTGEGANCGFKDQLQPETAFIFRRDLAKADLFKETVTVNIRNTISFGAKPQRA